MVEWSRSVQGVVVRKTSRRKGFRQSDVISVDTSNLQLPTALAVVSLLEGSSPVPVPCEPLSSASALADGATGPIEGSEMVPQRRVALGTIREAGELSFECLMIYSCEAQTSSMKEQRIRAETQHTTPGTHGSA